MKTPVNNEDVLGGFFKFGGKPILDGPKYEISLKSAGNMSFHWGVENAVRTSFLTKIADKRQNIVSVELIHSKIVCVATSENLLNGIKADGILTQEKNLIPVITVADCMPIFLYHHKSGTFGVLHSGWKGTGIVEEALKLAENKWHLDIEDFSVVLGPHIQDCCYTVDSERAEYFTKNFGAESVQKTQNGFSLSLTNANLYLLKIAGIPKENIIVHNECTVCDKRFFSFRRDAGKVGIPFSVQAAYVKW